MTKYPNSNQPTKPKQLARLCLPVLAGLTMIWLAAPAQAQNSIQYNFRQSQTKLSVTVESSQNINSSHWSWAGPLDDRSQCSNRVFPELDNNLKGQTPVTKLGAKGAQAEIDISPTNNNKLYCFIIEGYPTPRQLDYNPPVIELDDKSNLIKAQDTYHGSYGPSGGVNSNSWQVAVFDAKQKGSNYQCAANNQNLDFRSISGDVEYIGQYSWGNTNHLSYNVPDHRESAIEFFEKLQETVYTKEETDPALTPFIDDQWNPAFSDNIHFCHRVSDPQGNTAYKLMRLDFGGPTISLQIDGQAIRASSQAVDLDDSTWQYLATDQRHLRASCELIKVLSNPTGESAVENQAVDGHYYCFLVTDKQGNTGRAWIKADLDQNSNPPTESTTTNDPPPENNQQQNQQQTDSAPDPEQTNVEPITNQAAGVNEVSPVANPEPEVESTVNQPPEPDPTPAPTDNTETETAPENPTSPSQPTTAEPAVAKTTSDGVPVWALILAAITGLLVIVGGILLFLKAKGKPTDSTGK